MIGLEGRVAVVTGAARGIGQAIAERLVRDGATVVFADIDAGLAEEVARSQQTPAAVAHALDVADAASVAELARYVQSTYRRCDILINNAAILDMTSYASLTLARLDAVLKVNLFGAMSCTLQLVPLMRQGQWGRIVNIASIMGVRGSRDSIPYSTAKGGVVNLTRCLACDLAPDGIVVNAIAPGFINTRMAELPDGSGHEHETDWFKDIYLKYGRIPLGRAGLPADIAGVAAFLCSDDSGYVTGQVIMVDGGVSATF
jgi:NAD(P)-dependent dehydrogenase (short-subunit alcohol dehydrogenase family)